MSKVTYTIDGEKFTAENICYRVKGKVTFKGAVIFGCSCLPDFGLDNPYPLSLLTSSEDKYQTLYVYGYDTGWGFEQEWTWAYNRIGNALSSKATVAELGFDTYFLTGQTNACLRVWELAHAGFGKSAVIDKGEGTLDLSTLSGNVVGWALAPYCSTQDNSCPRCLDDDDCEFAIAFMPCEYEDPFEDYNEYWNYNGVAYGTFTLSFNKSYSDAIKSVPEDDAEGTVEALAAKAFKQIKSIDQVLWLGFID